MPARYKFHGAPALKLLTVMQERRAVFAIKGLAYRW